MNATTLKAVAFVAALIGLSSTANAQHLHSSHHHHDAMGHRIDDYGHHIDLYGHHTGNAGVYDNGLYDYGYNSRPSYYAPSTIVPSTSSYYVPSTYVQPQTVYRPVVTVPNNTIPGKPVLVSSTEDITISSPVTAQGEVRYLLGSNEYSMKPGYRQKFANDREWVIAFGSGGSRGEVRYTLGPGAFEFRLTDDGWDLVKLKSPHNASLTKPPPPPSE
jgi:hypothetical protein